MQNDTNVYLLSIKAIAVAFSVEILFGIEAFPASDVIYLGILRMSQTIARVVDGGTERIVDGYEEQIWRKFHFLAPYEPCGDVAKNQKISNRKNTFYFEQKYLFFQTSISFWGRNEFLEFKRHKGTKNCRIFFELQ